MHDDKDFEKALGAAIKLLASRPRSVADLASRLGKKLRFSHPEEDERRPLIAAVVERLKEYGYLDDERFAEQVVSGKLSRDAVGKQRLARDLAKMHVEKTTSKRVLEEAFEETPETDVLERALSKYLKSRGLPSTPQETKRLMEYLIRRGFPYGLVAERVRKLARSARLEAVEEALETLGDDFETG